MELSKTYELFDTELHKVVNTTAEHDIYLCPFCETKAGKVDKEGKFYWSREKEVGWCFRCMTVGFPETDSEVDNSQQKLERTIESTTKELNGNNFIHPPPIGFNFEDPTFAHLDYLRSRHVFLPPLAKSLGIKGWSGTNMGVVFPFIYRNYIARFQVRFDTQDKARRYYTSPGEHKILYSPQHVLSDFRLRREDTVTIVEGVFDAIAALVLGYPNPLAILGSSLTEYNAYLIRKLVPDNAFCFMDSKPLNDAVAAILKTSCPSIGRIECINHGDDVDPEEYLKEKIKDPVCFREYAGHVSDILRASQ